MTDDRKKEEVGDFQLMMHSQCVQFLSVHIGLEEVRITSQRETEEAKKASRKSSQWYT